MMSTVAQSPPKPSAPPPETKERPRSQPASASPSLADLSQAIRSAPGTPTWEMARFYPAQGDWTEAEYHALETNHLIELNHGVLEFLPMPTYSHVRLVRWLFLALNNFVEQHQLGEAYFAPTRVRLSDEVQREPDILYIPKDGKIEKQFTEDAALVVEVVSEGRENRRRDLTDKRADYAASGIPEYWIVDPQTQTITVLTLPEGGTEYAVHGEFQPGETASSVLLEGFIVDATACFAAADQAE